MKKKCLYLIMACLLCVSLVACNSGSGNTDAGDTGNEKYLIRVAHVLPTTHQTHITLEEVFKKEVEEKSNGRITVEIYPNAQLGGDRKAVESVQIGSLEMTVPASTVVTAFDEDWEVLDILYLFDSKEQALKNFDGPFGQALSEHLKTKGIINFGFGENGLRHVINNVRPIEKIEDMKGLKIRTMEGPMQVAGFKNMGANPTPISFNELFTALQQKTVDGAELPINIAYSNKIYEVQKYLSKTSHTYLTCPYLINKNFYESLPSDLQEVVKTAAIDTINAQREALAVDEGINTQKMLDEGVVINDITDDELQRFKDAIKPVLEDYKNTKGTTYLDLIEE